VEKALKFTFPPGPKNPFPCGLCGLINSDTFELASFVPLREKDKSIAALAVSSPFTAPLLNVIESKIAPLNAKKNGMGVAFYVMQGSKITASSPELQNSPYLSRLSTVLKDPFEEKSTIKESDGRLWKNLPMWGPDGEHPMGQVIICSRLPDYAVFVDPVLLGSLAAALLFFILGKSRK
jgi:hypothetical protein